MLKKHRSTILILFLFILISILVLSKLIFNDQLIGRSIDFSVPPVAFLLKNVLRFDFYTWSGSINGGLRNTFASTLIPANLILYLPVLFKSSSWFMARYQLVLSLTTAMFSFFLLGRKMLESLDLAENKRTALAILGALLFTLNNYFFCELIFGSTPMYFTFALIPLFLYLLISYLTSKKYYFFFLTIILLLIVSSTLQIFVMAYIFAIICAIIYKEYKATLKIIAVHLIASLYWILPLLVSATQLKSQELSGDFSSGLTDSSTNFVSSLINKDYFGNRELYTLSLNNQFLSWFWTLNAFALLLLCLYSLYRSQWLPRLYQKIVLWMAGVLTLSLLFIKGGKEPFGAFVLFLYKNFPLINLYRSLQHYIGFYVVSISILFLFSVFLLIKKNHKYFWLALLVVIINASPWLTRDLGRHAITSQGQIPSYVGEYKLTEGDFQLYSLNQKLQDFSLLTIPPNFSVYFMPNSGNLVKSQGGDTGLGYGNKAFYATDVGGELKTLLDPLERRLYLQDGFFDKNSKLLSFLNIKYLALRADIVPASSENYQLFDFNHLKDQLAKSTIFVSAQQYGETTIYKLKDFLPTIYTPQATIYSEGNLDQLINIASATDFNPRSLIIFSENQTDFGKLKADLGKVNSTLPVIEYKQVDPTKYHLVIHNAKGIFPLVLNQSYNTGWKLYPGRSEQQPAEALSKSLSDYRVLSGETDEQATAGDIQSYLSKNLISTLGDGRQKSRELTAFSDGQERNSSENYAIGFVSPLNYGTIQNDNLADGQVWQTWGKTEYQANHFVANGYSNGWVMNTDKFCSNKIGCKQNADGSYDLDVTIEFAPQRVFYIGLIISVGTLLLMLFYLLWKVLSRKNKKDV